MLIIKNCDIYNPKPLGQKDILIAEKKIQYISSDIQNPQGNFPKIDVVDGKGLKAIPGLIDLHVHIAGAGGEGGYLNRTPELMLTDFTLNGITTCVGLLGTDGVTRGMANLLAKAKSLEIEGITTYLWTGCYEVPTRTLTNSARGDIILIDKIIGIGEIAVSDHRSSHPSLNDLIHLASEARVGGMLSGKCGIIHMHMGDGKDGMKPLEYIAKESEIPYENILPTHVNRNKRLFNESINYALEGGYVDITTGIRPEGDDALNPWDAFKSLIEEGVSIEHITMSSDSGGSLPIFDENGRLIKMDIGMPKSNIEVVRELVRGGMSIEKAISPLTKTPAQLLKLNSKGSIVEGSDADIILVDEEFNIHTVIAKGRIMVRDYKPLVWGNFERFIKNIK